MNNKLMVKIRLLGNLSTWLVMNLSFSINISLAFGLCIIKTLCFAASLSTHFSIGTSLVLHAIAWFSSRGEILLSWELNPSDLVEDHGENDFYHIIEFP